MATLKEAVRILRQDGLIIVSAVLDTAVERVVWFTQLNVDLTKRCVEAVVPSVSQYEKMFHDVGIKCLQKLNILGSDFLKDYYNIDGPLDEKWRGSSGSYWSFATKEEIDVVIEKVKDLQESGEYEQWVNEHDHSGDTGIITIFICKPY